MSLKLVKNITRRSWDTILMPDTVIACVKKLACNKPNHFIFIDLRGFPIGYVKITGLDRDTHDSN